MEECSDNNNVKFGVTDSTNLIFKANFDRKLVEYDEQHQGSHRKAWTLERILEVINDIRKAQVAMNSGQRRTAMDYYWMSKYDIVTTANEDYLIFKKLDAAAPTVRILPRERYFDILLDIHQSCGHGGRDKILHDIKNRYYIPKKAVEIFVSLCPCESKKNAPRKAETAKRQWKKLRDCHREALRRRKFNRISPWKYEQAMEFIKNKTTKTQDEPANENQEVTPFFIEVSTDDTSHSNSKRSMEIEIEEEEIEDSERYGQDNQTDVFLEQPTEHHEVKPFPYLQAHSEDVHRQKRRRMGKDEDESNRERERHDAQTNLFLSLSEKTRLLPPHLQLRVQREIFNSVLQAEEEALNYS